MKKLTCFIIALCFVATGLGQGAAKAPHDRNSPEAKARRRMKFMQKTGGMVEDASTQKGNFYFLNIQQQVPVGDLEELTVETMRAYFRCKFSIQPCAKAFSASTAEALVKETGAEAGVFLIEDANLPSLLLAPESNWAAINVTKLAADKPGKALLAQRVRREMWRALGFLYGACSDTEMCVLQNISTLRDLDGIKANALSQYPLLRIRKRLPEIGITPIHVATYREACEKGWAPPPTNDFQKAIWDKVHTPPTTPITIEFDPKKGK